jgi:hypothetical protein
MQIRANPTAFVLFLIGTPHHRALMNAGPDLVLACPHCGALARLFTLSSASPIGAVSWTDGYQEAPLSPRQPNLIRCHGCGALYWTVQAREIGMIDPTASAENREARFADFTSPNPPEEGAPPPEAWLTAPQMEILDEAGYLQAIRDGLAQSPEQELELRVYAWWRGNDRYRKLESPSRHPTSPEAIENAERLIELATDGEHELVLFRAEALRQLGRFEEAQQSLYGLCSDYAPAREKLFELIEARSRDLDVMFIPTYPTSEDGDPSMAGYEEIPADENDGLTKPPIA